MQSLCVTGNVTLDFASQQRSGNMQQVFWPSAKSAASIRVEYFVITCIGLGT